jgi:hypothetical protein
MAVVVFDPDEFREINPQFAELTAGQLRFAFEAACLALDNSEGSPVPYNPPDVTVRKTILDLLVCHLCELKIRGNGVVGTMTNAAQGSVSAGFAAPADPGARWFNQTQCGASAWQLLSGFRLGGRLYRG